MKDLLQSKGPIILSMVKIVPITPNMLLLGRSSTEPPDTYVQPDDGHKLTRRMKFIHEVEEQWWRMWFCQIWHDLFPRNKWIQERENLEKGDVCLKGYSQSLKKGKYIICRVIETNPDEKGPVRTVKINFRPQSSKEKTLPYISRDLKEEIISVQRLVLICKAKDIQNDEMNPQVSVDSCENVATNNHISCSYEVQTCRVMSEDFDLDSPDVHCVQPPDDPCPEVHELSPSLPPGVLQGGLPGHH